MPAHAASCGRGQWLAGQRLSVELLAAVLFREGPRCSCTADCAVVAQSPDVDEHLVDEPLTSDARGA